MGRGIRSPSPQVSHAYHSQEKTRKLSRLAPRTFLGWKFSGAHIMTVIYLGPLKTVPLGFHSGSQVRSSSVHPCVLRSSSSCSLHFLTEADNRRLRPSPTPMASSRSVHAAPSVATQCASRIRFSCQPAKYAGKDISGLQTKSFSLQLLGLLGDL